MRVLLIQSYLDKREIKSPLELVFPLGLSFVATALEGHHVSIFDPNVVEDPFYHLKQRTIDSDPEIVGISIRILEGMYAHSILKGCEKAIEIVNNTVSHKPKIIVGGSGFSLHARRFFQLMPEIDFGVLGEGEKCFPELLANLENPEKVKGIFYRKEGSIYFTGEREKLNFDELPEPKRDLIDIRRYFNQPDALGVQTKRGCILNCIYCTYPFIDGNKLRLRSPKKVVDEIEHLVNIYGVKSITFVDNVFNIPLHHAEGICHEIIRRKIDIRWSAWFNESYINEEFIKLARDAGCYKIELSPDGFTDKTLKLLGKNITNKDIMRTYLILKDVEGVNVLYNFFVWPPGQDLVGFFKMAFFRLKAKIGFGDRLKEIGFAPLRILPNTELQRIAVREGVIKEDIDLLFFPALYWGSGMQWAVRFLKILFQLKRNLIEIRIRILRI